MIWWAMGFCLLFGWMCGHTEGWRKAHRAIASECKKLGGFYVLDEVYHCTKIELKEEPKPRRPKPPPAE